MFKRREIVEVSTTDPRHTFKARILRRCPHEGMSDWWEIKEIPDNAERAAILKRCDRMGFHGILCNQRYLRKISNRP